MLEIIVVVVVATAAAADLFCFFLSSFIVGNLNLCM